jgi:hypothetical protein
MRLIALFVMVALAVPASATGFERLSEEAKQDLCRALDRAACQALIEKWTYLEDWQERREIEKKWDPSAEERQLRESCSWMVEPVAPGTYVSPATRYTRDQCSRLLKTPFGQGPEWIPYYKYIESGSTPSRSTRP